jgi:hypothetical protein
MILSDFLGCFPLLRGKNALEPPEIVKVKLKYLPTSKVENAATKISLAAAFLA